MWAAIAVSVPGHFDVQCLATFFFAWTGTLVFINSDDCTTQKKFCWETSGLRTFNTTTSHQITHITHYSHHIYHLHHSHHSHYTWHITDITYITHITHITHDTSLTSLTSHITPHITHITHHWHHLNHSHHLHYTWHITHITHISHHTSLTSTHVTHRISPHHSQHIRHLNFGDLARARNVVFTNTNCQTATPKRLGSFVLAGSVTLVSKAAKFEYPVFTVWSQKINRFSGLVPVD